VQLLTLEQVLILHKRIIGQSGGAVGVRHQDGLESALAQPYMTFSGQALYPTLIEKAAALGFSLINNYPFILKKSVGPSKTPFALSLSKGERGFGSHLLGECAVSRSCFDRLSTNGSRHHLNLFF